MVANPVESKQAYFSSTVSSVTSETTGLLVNQLCNKSDSCTPCHDTDLNIKPCSMQLAKGCHSLAIYLQVRWSPVIKVTAFCFFFFFGILYDQNGGLNETDGERKRQKHRA